MSKERLARLCFGAIFVIAAFSLGLQFVQDWLGVWDDPGTVRPSHAVRVRRFFSYFTTQANLLVVATSLSLARRADRDGPGWRVARLNALTGITITGLVHWFLLHPLDHFRGLLWASDTLVHIIVPTLAVLGWLVFGRRRRISMRVVLLGMIWPAAWLIYTMVVGQITGWYPYFFLDLGQTSRSAVALYCVAILILLLSCLACSGWAIAGCRVARRDKSHGMGSRSTLVDCGCVRGDDLDLFSGHLATADTATLPATDPHLGRRLLIDDSRRPIRAHRDPGPMPAKRVSNGLGRCAELIDHKISRGIACGPAHRRPRSESFPGRLLAPPLTNHLHLMRFTGWVDSRSYYHKAVRHRRPVAGVD